MIRLDIITTLVSLRTNKVQQDAFVSLINSIKDLGRRRNDIIHGFWSGVYDDEEGRPAHLPKITARGKIVRRVTKVTAEDVDELSSEIFRLTSEFLFYMDFYVWLSQQSPPQPDQIIDRSSRPTAD
jgi:hypothetical protein